MAELLITHPQLVAALVKPPLDILNSLSLDKVDLWHGATGVAGETGELLEGIADKERSDLDKIDNIVEELGDIEFYVQQIRSRTNLHRAGAADDLALKNHTEGAAEQHIKNPLLHLAVQAAIAGSQVLDIIKKGAIYNKDVDGHALMDAFFNLDVAMGGIRLLINVTRQEVLDANIVKLSKRYASLGYSDAAAQERADKVEPERKFFTGDAPIT